MRIRGATTTARLAPAAVSGCPPSAPMITPSDAVRTFTLKLMSTSVAERIITSSSLATFPLAWGSAYISASISMCLGLSRIEATASASKVCTSRRASK